MRAIILAGGKGTRLRPYTTVFPKPLMPVGDRPILEVLIRQLAEHGVDHVTIAVGYLANLIKVYFGNGSQFGLKIDYSIEDKPLGTMGPLRLIDDLPENFLVLNGDVLTDLSYSNFFRSHCAGEHVFSVSSFRRELSSDFGVLKTDRDGTLVGFQEKPKFSLEVSMGVYAMHRRALNVIPIDVPFGFDQLMLKLIEQDQKPHVFAHDGEWLDIGRPEDYDLAQVKFGDVGGK